MSDVPSEVRRLAEQRAERRRAKDYEGADSLREKIESLGYEVTDLPDGTFDLVLRPDQEPWPEPRISHRDVPSVLHHYATADLSVHWLSEGWPEDVLRGIDSFRRFEGNCSARHVVVEAGPGGTPP